MEGTRLLLKYEDRDSGEVKVFGGPGRCFDGRPFAVVFVNNLCADAGPVEECIEYVTRLSCFHKYGRCI